MNCRECEPLLTEAARMGAVSAPMDGAVSTEIGSALEHAATCASCAERLAEERAVSAGLRRLALAESAGGPSTGCEATLMAAYRMERGREVHTRRWIFAVSGAMAASLVVLLGAALVLTSESGWLVRSMSERLGPLSAGNHVAQPATTATNTAGEVAGETAAGQQEEVTNFVPYYPGADVNALDGGALVRVRVPTSELSAFGLPVGQASEDQWVSADLLVGEDGSPQAIRFVRTAPAAPGSRN